jgi:hypothetical protein
MKAVGKGLFAASVTLALLVSAANAQSMGGGGGHKGHEDSAAKSDAQMPKADEKAYAQAINSLPDKKHDPWQGVR